MIPGTSPQLQDGDKPFAATGSSPFPQLGLEILFEEFRVPTDNTT
jgi:hypothetical protein